MKRRVVPRVPKDAAGERRAFDEAVKENIDTLTGVRGAKIVALPASASLDDVIAKVNEIVVRLQ